MGEATSSAHEVDSGFEMRSPSEPLPGGVADIMEVEEGEIASSGRVLEVSRIALAAKVRVGRSRRGGK